MHFHELVLLRLARLVQCISNGNKLFSIYSQHTDQGVGTIDQHMLLVVVLCQTLAGFSTEAVCVCLGKQRDSHCQCC